MTLITKPGSYTISSQDYHADQVCEKPCLSRSIIKDLVFSSPARAWFNHPRLNPLYTPDNGGGKFDIGSAVHSLILEGLDNIVIVDADDWRTKAAKEVRDQAWKEGKSPLLTAQYGQAKTIADVVDRRILECGELGIKNLRTEGDAELTYVWEEDGVWIKARPDWISKDRTLILDIKTTNQTANPIDIGKTIVNMGYDIQSVLYQRGVTAVTGGKTPVFVFVLVEVDPPHLCSFVILPNMAEITGLQKVENGIHIWRACIQEDLWPGYPNKIVTANIPRWSYAQWEERNLIIGAD